MQFLAIEASSGEVSELELQMQANTLYTYFDSILIDELMPLNGHVVYSDANALSEKKKAYFIGEQLVLGDALICARDDFEDRDVVISKEALESAITKDVSAFYITVLEILSQSDINLYKLFEVSRADETLQLNTEWVLYTFNIADSKTREYFIQELQNVLQSDGNVMEYMQKMATLAMNAAG